MVETGGSSKVVDDHQKWVEQHNYRRENPLSVRERIQFYIDSAEAGLQIAVRDQDLNAQGEMRALIREAKTARELFQTGDIERALIAYDHMHGHREKCNLPVYEKAFQRNRGKGKEGKYGPVRRMLICLTEIIESTDEGKVFRYWQKANPDKQFESENGECWQLEAERKKRRQGIDADQDQPDDFKYLYYRNQAENPVLVTVANIKRTLKKIK